MCNCIEETRKDLLKELDATMVKFECTPTNLRTMESYFGVRFSYRQKNGKTKTSFIRPMYCCMCGKRLTNEV